MRPVTIKFHDKKDVRPLPQIPSEHFERWRDLVETKLTPPGLTYFERLEAAYAFLDRYNAFVATFAVCQKGCSHCCRMEVQVSRLEAEYITLKVGPQLDRGKTWTIGHRNACPFLGEFGVCTIYENRPFNCRTFHTLDDPKYCADGDESHQVYGAAGYGYGVFFYKELAEWLKHVHQTQPQAYRDIRDWFPRARALMNEH